jgi:hypothetical protein
LIEDTGYSQAVVGQIWHLPSQILELADKELADWETCELHRVLGRAAVGEQLFGGHSPSGTPCKQPRSLASLCWEVINVPNGSTTWFFEVEED